MMGVIESAPLDESRHAFGGHQMNLWHRPASTAQVRRKPATKPLVRSTQLAQKRGASTAGHLCSDVATEKRSSTRHSSFSPSLVGGFKRCDKCDGPHATERCPHFVKPREQHKDAWVNYGQKKPLQMGCDGGHFVLRNARIVRQPGDGSCLFHSLCYGLGDRTSAATLRRELARFVADNPQLEIAGDSIEEWVRWDSGSSCDSYARRMHQGHWGGGIEMAAFAQLKGVNVHVYEQRGGQFKRISCFNSSNAHRTVHVLYQGRMHYDALVV